MDKNTVVGFTLIFVLMLGWFYFTLPSEEQLAEITTKAEAIMSALKAENISVKYDHRTTQRPGAKFAQHELQGVPLRLAIGPKDLESGTAELARRDTLTKQVVDLENLTATVKTLINEIQTALFQKALDFRADHITQVDTFDVFKTVLEENGGFISAHWDGSKETEEKIKNETKATIRCIPLDAKEENGKCMVTGKPSNKRVIFAKAY